MTNDLNENWLVDVESQERWLTVERSLSACEGSACNPPAFCRTHRAGRLALTALRVQFTEGQSELATMRADLASVGAQSVRQLLKENPSMTKREHK